VPAGEKSFAGDCRKFARRILEREPHSPGMKLVCKPTPLALLLAAGVLMTSCGGGGGGESGIHPGAPQPDANPGLPATISVAPVNTGDGWGVSNPTAEDMDSAAVLTTLQAIRDGSFPGVDAMVVVRHGRLVAEGYFNGYGPDTLHDLRSTGKSFTSAMAGIAIQQGLFQLDDPIASLIPQFESHSNMDSRKRAITIRNLLDMRSGLGVQRLGQRVARQRGADVPDARLGRFHPGSADDDGSRRVCVVLHGRGHRSRADHRVAFGDDARCVRRRLSIRASWRSAIDLAQGTRWQRHRWRRPETPAPRCARLGQLYLNGGTWNGARVVPADWVARSRETVTTLGNDGYGLLWWKRSFFRTGGNVDSFFTSGNGGNFIFVFPALDLVVMFTGSNYDSPSGDQPFGIVGNSVLPAVR
jgi:CubicO group peptidase (beta-lactamase class C family)